MGKRLAYHGVPAVSLDVNDPELDRLAREVAQATGETEAEAVKTALRERLERVRPAPATEPPSPPDEAEIRVRRERILESARRFRALPILDTRSEDEILGYDENGLPS
jgi:antitoxin VapB